MTRSQLKRMIKPLLLKMTKGQRKALFSRRVVTRYPLRAEKAMQSVLTKLFSVYTKKVNSFFKTHKPLYAMYETALKRDSFESDFEGFINEMASSLDEDQSLGLINGISLEVYVGRIMEFIRTFDEKELELAFQKMFKMGLPYSDTWWAGLRSQLIDEFSRRSIGTVKAYLADIRDEVLKGIRNEVPFDQLVLRIQQLGEGLSLKKAAFLARDLTGKINGLFTKNLHSALGMTNYMFITAFDERVRGRPGGAFANAPVDHWVLDGKICSWSDSTIYSIDYGRTFIPRGGRMLRLHPGMDWACRCTASPWFQDIFLELEKEIRGGY
jgi:hypothetical protein